MMKNLGRKLKEKKLIKIKKNNRKIKEFLNRKITIQNWVKRLIRIMSKVNSTKLLAEWKTNKIIKVLK